MSRFIKIFLISASVFAAVMSYFYIEDYGKERGLAAGASAGIMFGFIMAASLTAISHFTTRKAGNPKAASKVRQNVFITIPLPFNEAYRLVMDSLDALGKYKIEHSDEEQGGIKLKTGTTWRSWGEEMVVLAKKTDNENETRVNILSGPNVKTTMVDFGKNYRNVEAVISKIEETAPVKREDQ
ncbi:hypothetical protein [Limisalsivibrio acetivorans]|uniref:hypothetical protein n=1 Tax=Limisalsivibrio acetivorans TaxID=1304888 RepID=UPI0003B40D18|nr:hypothetical protein [Limisalsivibrio acetivorans]